MKLLQWTFLILFFLSFQSNSYSQFCNAEDSIAMYRLRDGLSLNTFWVGNIDTWFGITTVPDPGSTIHYRISGINIGGQNIASGTIPDSIFHGDRLTLLEYLNVSSNYITGIDGFLKPNNAGPLHSLKEINISYNQFTPGNSTFFNYFLSNMDSLTGFTAQSAFNGSSTFSIYNLTSLTSLQSLDVSYNSLGGTLDIANLLSLYPNLLYLYVDNNLFTTVVPPLASSYILAKLSISENTLQTFEPLSILLNNMPSMQFLWASNAMDTANVQDTLIFNITSSNPNLLELDISNNKLRGTFPSDILEKFPSLYSLYINNNLIHGNLPEAKTTLSAGPFNNVKVYGSLKDIGQLDISDNLLSGDLRMDWIFGNQLLSNFSSAGSNMNLERFYAHNNHFDRVMPQLSNATIYGVSTALAQRFSNLEEVFIDNNNLDFKDLFRLKRIFRFQQVNITGQSYYMPQSGTASSSFSYSPQGDLGIGGVRRRNAGLRITLDSDNGIEEAEVGFINYIGNKYNWERIDTAGLAGGTPAVPVSQPLGQTQQLGGGIASNLLTDNTGGLASTDPTYLIGVDSTSSNTHKIGIDNLDSLNHHGWLFKATITNDSFPLLTLKTIPKKIEVAGCVDGSGAPVHCQTMIVQFHPDTLALLSPLQQDSLKNAIRTELGAVPIDVCLCGDIELWGLSDTATTMLEGNSQGTKNAASSASAKPQLLSADPNYSLLGGTSSGLPDTVAITAGSGNKTAKTLVAIVDSGVDYEYTALTPYISEGASTASTCLPNAVWGYNFYSDNNNATDDHGHGTSVAGIVAGISQQSILPDTGSMKTDIGILPLKYTDKNGAGSLFHAACALRYAADYERPTTSSGTAKVRVINTSWGYYGDPCIVLENVLKYVGEDCGILVVASAGNKGIKVEGIKANRHWPSNSIWDTTGTVTIDNILAVAGVDPLSDTLNALSNYGSVHIDVVAPWYEMSIKAGSTVNFEAVGGTSFSAPQVARAAALLFDKYPEATYFAVKYALMEGVDVLQSDDSLNIRSKGRINFHKADSIMNVISDRSSCSRYFNTISVDKIEGLEQFVQVYPNPFASELLIDIDQTLSNSETIKIQLFNIQGQLLQQQLLPPNTNTTSLHTKDLPVGVYVLQLNIGNNQYSKKVIKFNP